MPIWSLEWDDPLFAAAFHPEKREFVLGFASGKVAAYKYTYESVPEEIWSTKRHKSSCRAIAYSQDGASVYTLGSDKVIKKAASDTGRVQGKTALDNVPSAMTINSHYLYIGDEEGNLVVFDLNLKQTHSFENTVPDCVNSISAMEYKNQYHVILTGMSSLVHIDIRKGVLTTSEDQEDELLCGAVLGERQSAFGMADGVLTYWNNDHLLDQQSRIRLSKEGTVDAVLAGETEEIVIAGTSDGTVFEVDTKASKIKNTIAHASPHEGEEVTILDWDCDYHLATGSMERLTLWDKDEHNQEQIKEAAKAPKNKKRKHKAKNAKGQEAKRNKMFADL